MKKPSPIAEALAALNDAFNVTTVALDVRKDETGFAARLDPKISDAVLGLIQAVFAERDAADAEAMRAAMEQWTPSVRPTSEPVPTLEDRIRAIVREEIAADRLAVGPVFREAPAAAIEMAIAHEAQLAPTREEVLRALSRVRSDAFKDTF